MNFLLKLGDRLYIEQRNKPHGNELRSLPNDWNDIEVLDIEVIETHEYAITGYTDPVVELDENGNHVVVTPAQPIYGDEIIKTTISYDVSFSQSKYDAKDAIIAAKLAEEEAARPFENIKSAIRSARAFGEDLGIEFGAENVVLGISADGKSSEVLDKLTHIIAALNVGSLDVAIDLIKNFDVTKKDAKYITDERLIKYLNLIEGYLGLPLSETLGG